MIRNTSGFAPEKDAIIFRIEDFGAIGDGETNDGHAFGKAMRAIGEAPKDVQKVLYLKPDTTYRITEIGEVDHKGNGISCTIQLTDCDNVAIVGDNSALSIKIPCGFLDLQRCNNIHISGIDAGFNPSPMVVGKIKSFTPDGEWFEFEVDEDEDCGLEVGVPLENIPHGIAFFMLPNNPDLRQDFFLTSMELVRPGLLRVRQLVDWVKNKIQWYMHGVKIGDEFVIPRWGYGQVLMGGRIPSMSYGYVDGFVMHSCHIHDIPLMVAGFSMCGDMLFKNVHVMPKEGDRNLLVSWRDGYHCKDHVKPAVWEDCTIGMLGDDVYNIATCDRTVKTVIDEKTFIMDKILLKAGDTLATIDVNDGKFFGESKVAAVDAESRDGEIVVTLENAIDGLVDGAKLNVMFTSTNPGLIIRNTKMVGSIRVKAPAIFENCDIRTSIFYISNESTCGEGPIPYGITLKNCDIVSTYPGQAWLDTPTIPTNEELLAGAPDSNLVIYVNAQKNNKEAVADEAYKPRNITIEKCRIVGKCDFNDYDVNFIE